jgi:hypothetical protein
LPKGVSVIVNQSTVNLVCWGMLKIGWSKEAG